LENTFTIDNIKVTYNPGEMIAAAASRAGVIIPTLCHDERVKPYGACGICVLEEIGKPRLVRACSSVPTQDAQYFSDTVRVKLTRRTVLELLLSDHKGDCLPPCKLACPAQTDCRGYVGLIANGEYEAAAALMREKLPLPRSLGRVCPHPCEDACRRELVEEPINIAHLKYFAADMFPPVKPEIPAETGKRIAVIGGGPGGLSAAYFTRLKGHAVTLYDQNPEMGGMLRYGIPEYRLPRNVIAEESQFIEGLGVKFVNNAKIGDNYSFKEIRDKHDAVIVAIGAWTSAGLNIPGDSLPGVTGGIEFLLEVAKGNPPSCKDKCVAIVGGGNTAMDAARTAVRLGAKSVTVVYRRTQKEMPALPIEIMEGLEESVEFKYLSAPVSIEESAGALRFHIQKMELGEPDVNGRRTPIAVEGAMEALDVDMVIAAIGQSVNFAGFEDVGFDLSRRSTILVDEVTCESSVPGVFAVGDAVNKGPHIAVSAIAHAERAARAVDLHLQGFCLLYNKPILVEQELSKDCFAHVNKQARQKMPHNMPEERKVSFVEVNHGYGAEDAQREAARCLECGCDDFYECKLIKYANEYSADVNKYKGDSHIVKSKIDEHKNIVRNEGKCILCGICVRVCDERIGIASLGLAGRGFNTAAIPAMGGTLNEAGCVSCGSCVSLCPTGALTERATNKYIAVQEEFAETICPGCTLACPVTAAVYGGKLRRVLPRGEKTLLCEKGKFYFTSDEFNTNRLTHAVIKGVPSDVGAATAALAAKMQEVYGKYGAGSICIALSPSMTSGDFEYINNYVKQFKPVLATYMPQNLPRLTLEDMIENPDLKRVRFLGEENIKAVEGIVYLDPAEPIGRGVKLLFAVGEHPWEINLDNLEFYAITSRTPCEADVVLPLIGNPMLK